MILEDYQFFPSLSEILDGILKAQYDVLMNEQWDKNPIKIKGIYDLQT